MNWDDLNSITMTFQQCHDLYSTDVRALAIATIIGILIIAVMCMYLVIQNVKFRKFIEQNNLAKKFREWKEDNKGL